MLVTTRRAAGVCLAALFVLVLPANIYAEIAQLSYGAEPLLTRISAQVLFIAAALWAARSGTPVRPALAGLRREQVLSRC